MPNKRFFIIATPRSGSTWLEQTMDAHADIRCLHEPLNLLAVRGLRLLSFGRPRMIADALSRVGLRLNYPVERLERELAQERKPWAGAKILLPHVFSETDFVNFFIHYQSARLVLLDRESLVDGMCSWIIAQRTRQWNAEAPRLESIPPFAVPMERAHYGMARHLLSRKLLLTMLKSLDIRTLSLSYEAMMADTPAALARVAALLEVGAFTEVSRLQKLTTQPYRDIITNYDALTAMEHALKQRFAD
jgi:LPS sulfotransferase NodH